MTLRNCLLGLVFLAPALAGCNEGPELATVSGLVTLDGKPIPLATVEFIPENGRPSQAQTDENGKYALLHTRDKPGSLIGRHKVRISTWRQNEIDAQERVTRHPETLPAEYNYDSKLTFDVRPGQANVANFELKSGGKVIQPPK